MQSPWRTSVATASDSELQAVLGSLQAGNWRTTNSSMHSFFAVRDELPASNGCLLRNDHLVIPTSLRLQVLQLAHAHEFDSTAKSGCHECHPTQNTTSSNAEHVQRPHLQLSHNQVPPPIATPAATRPFQYASTNLYGPLPSGEYLLAIVDQFTRYPEVANLHSASSHTVIIRLRRVFSRYSFPETLITDVDNGPQLTSTEFQQLLR